MTEQAEAGHVGRAGDPGGQRLLACAGVERGHDLDGGREHLAGCLVPGVQHAAADRLCQRQRQARPAGVDAEQRGRVGEPGDGHAVLRFRVVDAVPARDVAVRRGGHVQPASQHLGGQVGAEQVARPAEQVERDQRVAADGVHIRQRVGRRDLPEGVGVVHDRGEKVGGRDDRPVRRDLDHGRVVAVLDADEQVGRLPRRNQPGDRVLELARRDLARATAAARVLGQPYLRLSRHIRTLCNGVAASRADILESAAAWN